MLDTFGCARAQMPAPPMRGRCSSREASTQQGPQPGHAPAERHRGDHRVGGGRLGGVEHAHQLQAVAQAVVDACTAARQVGRGSLRLPTSGSLGGVAAAWRSLCAWRAGSGAQQGLHNSAVPAPALQRQARPGLTSGRRRRRLPGRCRSPAGCARRRRRCPSQCLAQSRSSTG